MLMHNLSTACADVLVWPGCAGCSCPASACSQELPEAPAELVTQLSRRYIQLYEKITGEQFEPVLSAQDPQERMAAAIQAALQQLQC